MKENFSEVKHKVKVSLHGLMGTTMRDHIMITKQMEWEVNNLRTAVCTLVSGKMVNSMGKGHKYGLLEYNTLDNFRMINNMVQES